MSFFLFEIPGLAGDSLLRFYNTLAQLGDLFIKGLYTSVNDSDKVVATHLSFGKGRLQCRQITPQTLDLFLKLGYLALQSFIVELQFRNFFVVYL